MLKKIFSFLFKKKDPDEDIKNLVTIQLNEKVMPLDRGAIYEDPIDEFLRERGSGEVSGGGTLQLKSGELAYCDISVRLSTLPINRPLLQEIIEKLESYGAPKGSKIIIEYTGEEIPFGKREGLALYIDAQNLEPEVYQSCDINYVISEVTRLIGIEPNADRHWQGENETALYFFGESFEEMKNSISNFVTSYPLSKGSRIVQIA